ncbi:MAG: SMP-30/gluconolactonase/LRE family protein [Chitinophagaceae bacterium]
MKLIHLFAAILIFASCKSNKEISVRTMGKIEVMDTALVAVLDTNAQFEIIAEGHEWTEGPLWIEAEKKLLYSDIPNNKIYQWTAEKGSQLYLDKAGYTGSATRGGELGSNGLLLDKNGRLVLCQHGDRRIAVMDAAINKPESNFITLADQYDGKKLNSPNDACFRSNGDLFFTDPPYGLVGKMDDPGKELTFQGVYKLSNGKVQLLTDSITRPNGIVLLNNEKTLLIANSDPDVSKWYLFDLGPGDSLINPRLLFDASAYVNHNSKDLPDGMKVDSKGNIFATGPGGVFIFNAEGKLLGRMLIPELCSNVALTSDEKTLFITADNYVLRVKLR